MSRSDVLAFSYRRFCITCALPSDRPISRFPGATIRGGFGVTLRSLVCATPKQACSSCVLQQHCAWNWLFETPPPADIPSAHGYEKAPHPFVMRPVQQGNRLCIEVILFGNSAGYLPYFIYTFNRMGARGVGKQRIPFTVTGVTADGRSIYDDSSEGVDISDIPVQTTTVSPGADRTGVVEIHFTTPTILRRAGRMHTGYDAPLIIRSLFRRMTNIIKFHEPGGAQKQFNPSPWFAVAETLTSLSRLKPVKQERYSTRQEKWLDYTGMVGSVRLSGNVGALMPLLDAGRISGIGKNTVFGYGSYTLEPGKPE